MGAKEDFIFWQIVNYFLVEKKYHIISMAQDQSEIWLENFSEKTHPVVRLKRKDIDWSNWVRRDLEITVHNGLRVKKAFYRRNLHILNIYVSPFPPVDEGNVPIEGEFPFAKEKLSLQSLLINGADLPRSLHKLSQTLELEQWPYPMKEEYDPMEVEAFKGYLLHKALTEAKKEKGLLQRATPIFTYIFLGLQVLLFLLMELYGLGYGGSQNLFVLDLFGAKINGRILAGEWWRFITPMFLHIGFFHLFMNSLSLYYLGTTVERIYGNGRFLFIYLFSGFFGTLASFIFTVNPSAGASGAIFGCFGALVYFGIRKPGTFQRMAGSNIIGLLIFNLVLGFIVPTIDNAGHVGGLIGGFLASCIMDLPKTKNWKTQIPALIFTIIFTLFALYYGFNIANA